MEGEHINPQKFEDALKTQNEQSQLSGRTPLARTAHAAGEVLKPLPDPGDVTEKTIERGLQAAGAGLGGLAGYVSGNPWAGAAAAASGLAVPSAIGGAVRSPTAQQIIRGQHPVQQGLAAMPRPLTAAPGVGAEFGPKLMGTDNLAPGANDPLSSGLGGNP